MRAGVVQRIDAAPCFSPSEAEDRIALVRQLGDAGQAGGAGHAVVGDQIETVLFRVLANPEHVGAAAGHAGHGVGHRVVQRVRRMIRVAHHPGPACAGALEIDGDVGAALLEVIGGRQAVEQTAQRLFAAVFRVRENDDGCFLDGFLS